MSAVIRLVFVTALRDRLFSGLAGLAVLTFALSLFLGGAAVTEQREAGMVYAAGVTRLLLVFGLIVFVALQTQRLYESREIEAIFSKALSRTRFVIAFWCGFASSAVVLVIPVTLVLFVLYGRSLGMMVWSLSLLVECILVVSFALFAALSLERAISTIFTTLAFYSFTRLIGFLLGIRDSTPDVGPNRFVNPMLDGLGLVLPRVDLMTQTRWLVYGFENTDQALIVLLQAVVFICLALAAAAYDLRHKQF